MAYRVHLSGRYIRKNVARLTQRAGVTSDPRHRFYKAMLDHDTYESYLEHVGGVRVDVATYRAGLISGRQEILYARDNGWIADSK